MDLNIASKIAHGTNGDQIIYLYSNMSIDMKACTIYNLISPDCPMAKCNTKRIKKIEIY